MSKVTLSIIMTAAAIIMGCSGGGGSNQTIPVTPVVVRWAQPSYTFGQGWNQIASVTIAGAPPTIGIEVADIDSAIPGGPTHGQTVYMGSNGTVNVPFSRGTNHGVWRFEASVIVGNNRYTDTVSLSE